MVVNYLEKIREKFQNELIDLNLLLNIALSEQRENEEIIKLLEVNEDKVTSIDVQGVFKEFYNIDIASVPVVKFDEPLDKKYYIN